MKVLPGGLWETLPDICLTGSGLDDVSVDAHDSVKCSNDDDGNFFRIPASSSF